MRRSILTTGGSLLHLLKPTTAASGLTAHIYHRHTHQFPLKPNTCAARTLFTAMASKAGPAPPQAPNDFSYDASAITETVKAAIERTRSLEDGIGSLKPEDCTFETVVKPLALDEAVLDTQTDPACFMQSVSTNKLVRDAATEATMKLSDFGIEVSEPLTIYLVSRDLLVEGPLLLQYPLTDNHDFVTEHSHPCEKTSTRHSSMLSRTPKPIRSMQSRKGCLTGCSETSEGPDWDFQRTSRSDTRRSRRRSQTSASSSARRVRLGSDSYPGTVAQVGKKD